MGTGGCQRDRQAGTARTMESGGAAARRPASPRPNPQSATITPHAILAPAPPMGCETWSSEFS